MIPQPAPSLSAADRARLRARHLADQEAAERLARSGSVPPAVVLAARMLVVAFMLAGLYAVAAASGLLQPAAWSALGTMP